ncbi:MAG: tetratricopeptide repeat protein [bacterium]
MNSRGGIDGARPAVRAKSRSGGSIATVLLAFIAVIAALVAGGCQDRAARDAASGGSAASGGKAKSSSAGSVITIAVLPFDNVSGETANDYVSTGFAEELARMVGGLAPANVRVIAPESARWFKRSEQDVAAAATELGAQFVVRGSVERHSEVVKIAAEVMPTAGGAVKWSTTHECDMKDAGAQLKEMAQAVVRAAAGLGTEIVDREPGRGSAKFSMVYDTHIKARVLLVEAGPDELLQVIELYENSLQMDPEFRLTYAGIGLAHQAAGDLPSAKWGARMNVVKGRSRGMKSMERGEEFCEARTLAAIALTRIDGRWAQGEEAFQRAIALNPSYVPARAAYSDFLSATGRTADAIAQAELVCTLDPLAASARALLGERRLEAGDAAGATKEFTGAIALDTTCLPARIGLTSTLIQQKKYDEAIAMATSAVDQSERSAPAMAQLARALAGAGRADEARALLDELETRVAKSFVSPYAMAVAAASIGDTEAAFGLLDKAILDRSRPVGLIDRDPAIASLRSDPRYETVRVKLGLAAPPPQPPPQP